MGASCGRREMDKQEMLEHILKYMDQDMEWAVDHYHQAKSTEAQTYYQGWRDGVEHVSRMVSHLLDIEKGDYHVDGVSV
jgi:hypothetical protein